MLPDNGQVEEQVAPGGKSPFAAWFKPLDSSAAARVAIALYRFEKGNYGSVKSLGGGLFEVKLPPGPGYRTYFGRGDHHRIILLTGGTKRRQHQDIRRARFFWRDFVANEEKQ